LSHWHKENTIRSQTPGVSQKPLGSDDKCKLEQAQEGYMTIDKALLREALAHYRVWNEDVFIDRVLRVGEQTPAEKWRAYKELMSFGLKIRPTPSTWQQRWTMEDWETYYGRIKKFEERRIE
jgi:hypothetical protein